MAGENRVKAQRRDGAGQKGDKLGKLIQRFTPTQNRPALLAVAIITVVLALGAVGVALLGVDRETRPWVFGVAAILSGTGWVCLLLLKFGGSRSAFEIRKLGVRYTTRRTEEYLFWEEITDIDIRRVVQAPGSRGGTMRYEILLVGSETIHLTNSFLNSLDDPTSLIRTLKRYSGKDFEVVVG